MGSQRGIGGALLTAAAACLAIASPVAAQANKGPQQQAAGPAAGPAGLAPGFEQRVYDLTTLVTTLPDFPPSSIELRSPAQTGQGPAGVTFSLEEPAGHFLSLEAFVRLIQANIAEDTWSDKRTSIEAMGNELIVVQTPEVHAKIAQMLAYIRRETELQVAVEGTVALVEDALLDEWRAGAPGAVALSDDAAKALADALDKGERAVAVRSLRALARNGQLVTASAVAQHAYVSDYDVQCTTYAASYDPIIGYLSLGAVLGVRPMVTRGHVACEVRFSHGDGPLPIPRFETGIPGMGMIGLPELSVGAVETTVTGRDGQTLLVGRVAAGEGSLAPRKVERIGRLDAAPAAGAASRSLCFFVRPTVVPWEALPPPASEEKRQMRVFDVGLLTTPLRDFPGPSAERIGAGAGMTVVAEPEPMEWVAAGTLVESIRHNVAPESWENTRNSIEVEHNALVVRQAPAVLDEIEKYLDRMAERRWHMIATRTDLVAADAAGARALRAKYPSLGAGATRLAPADAAALLAQAAKGEGGLSLLASGEVAGMNRQRVHVHQGGQQAYVRDYDIELATMVAAHDPQVDVIGDGFTVDCRPVLSGDGKTVHAELRVTCVRLDRPIATENVNDKGFKIHRPALASVPLRASLVAGAGDVMLVGGAGPIKLGGAEKHVLAIVRCAPAP